MAAAIWLANPRGFCAGVVRAIEIVELLLERHGPPIYVKHEVVHNRRVIDKLSAQGVYFIEDPKTVPKGSILVFSAHGVSRAVRAKAEAQGLEVHDATCPLVTKVHAQVRRIHSEGRRILMIGHKGHPEVEGTMGQVDDGIDLIESIDDANQIVIDDPERLAYVTQTTLSVEETAQIIAALKSRFPLIRGPAKEDICYATTNRQAAVRKMADDCDLVLVVGSANSSNSNRLRELAQRHGCEAKLIDDASDIKPEWLEHSRRIGITAGASAPEEVVAEVVERLRSHSPEAQIDELDGVREDVVFSVPKTLLTGQPAGGSAGSAG